MRVLTSFLTQVSIVQRPLNIVVAGEQNSRIITIDSKSCKIILLNKMIFCLNCDNMAASLPSDLLYSVCICVSLTLATHAYSAVV